jgi:hypothetical protein
VQKLRMKLLGSAWSVQALGIPAGGNPCLTLHLRGKRNRPLGQLPRPPLCWDVDRLTTLPRPGFCRQSLSL